jgi:hypothetical protein
LPIVSGNNFYTALEKLRLLHDFNVYDGKFTHATSLPLEEEKKEL